MNKKIVLLIGIVGFSLASFAQQNTASPYSYFGIGQVLFNGTEDVKAMGGLGIKGDSVSLNLSNPASYSHLKFTNFAVGATTSFNKLKSNSQSDNAQRTTLDYIALGIPMGKFGGSFGLVPFSSTGYKLQSTFVDEDGYERTQTFSGSGTINRFFVGLSYFVTPKLSVGANLEYNFGNLDNQINETISTVIEGTREANEMVIRGASASFGAMYKDKLNEKLELYSSVLYAPKASLSSDNTRNIATVTYNSSGVEYVYSEEDIVVQNNDEVIPSKFALGLGIGEKNKWMIGTEVTFMQNSQMNNRFSNNVENYTYENGQKYVIGGFYIPKFDSFSSIFNRSVYRAGFRYTKSGLVLNSENINDFGINFGVGIPVGLSKVDLGLEYGKRGTTNSNLVQENYFNISIGLSLSDKWFRKTLVD